MLGSGEVTHGLDIVPSLRDENLRRLGRAVESLDAVREDGSACRVEEVAAGSRCACKTSAGALVLVAVPWGTRGYDDIRIRGNRENLGQGLRPQIASLVDLTRMLEASMRNEDGERVHRLRRLMELERSSTPPRSRHRA